MPGSFRPVSTAALARWIFTELDARETVFGIPRRHFYVPASAPVYRTRAFGHPLDNPFGPAAGPHTQMAQNIVAAWLCGARYIELKTVQTLDRIEVSKPCIDMRDEGYNVEWSQELTVRQSAEEYLRAWVLLHALHHRLGFPGAAPNVVFNLSVGYDLAGLQQENMQWFLDCMQDGGDFLQSVIDETAAVYPPVADLDIPARVSDSVTLSTMHGCPPDEIGRIAEYLLTERGLHTLVKCNPTLAGPATVRKILNDELGFRDVVVPDSAFEHDLDLDDAIPMLAGLQETARANHLEFGVKLTNTLEVENRVERFAGDDAHAYLSGPPLHVLALETARLLAVAFDGAVPMSFSAGANCDNAATLLACGMQTVTACSDLLKTGGYLRLRDYLDRTADAFEAAGAASIGEFVLCRAGATMDRRAAARRNLEACAQAARGDAAYGPNPCVTARSKTTRPLDWFDCVAAPCTDACAIDQNVPAYLRAVRDGDDERAQRIVRQDNPLPCILGRACDQLCEQACVRVHLDAPLAIRNIKRFVMDRAPAATALPIAARPGRRVAVIGAGPAGLAAASVLAEAGVAVEVFEQHQVPGGMTSGAVPAYRLPADVVARDFDRLRELGVPRHCGTRIGDDLTIAQLRDAGFDTFAVLTGAQRGTTLPFDAGDCDDVIDALDYLRQARSTTPGPIGPRVGVIGGGDTAIDCARVAWRRTGTDVTLIYRRTVEQMPADAEEIEQLREEGIRVIELAAPRALQTERGRLRALVCRRMTLGDERDASGRRRPLPIPGDDFELPLDTLIVAIGQETALDFLEPEGVARNARGFIVTDPATGETSVPGIYAGGDVADDGPASIVAAAAAGKTIARSILNAPAHAASPPPAPTGRAVADLVVRRGRKLPRRRAPRTPVADRRGDTEVLRTLTAAQARAEASRCLDCDTWCGLCTTVCPNLAIQAWETGAEHHQRWQVLVLADLCNECGNCTTFCPTAGEPWRDKPRLFASRTDFEAAFDNAFRLHGHGIEARRDGQTVRLDGDADTGDAYLAPLRVLLQGVRRSAPWLPCMPPEEH